MEVARRKDTLKKGLDESMQGQNLHNSLISDWERTKFLVFKYSLKYDLCLC